MKGSHVRTLSLFLLSCALTSWAASAHAQVFEHAFVVRREQGRVTWEARGARPLEQMVSMLRDEYGLRVDFEEPPYESDFDLVDVTAERLKLAPPGSPPLRGMRGRF